MGAKLRQAERSFEMQPSTMRADVCGEIKPLVALTFALAEIEQAQETFFKKAHIGKIVLRVR